MILTFEATSAEELKHKVINYVRVMYNEGQGQKAEDLRMSLPLPMTGIAAPLNETTAEPAGENALKPAAKRGRPRKVKAQEEAEPVLEKEIQEAPEPVAETQKVELTKDAVVNALSEVNGKCGINKAREILSRFGANRMSELKAEFYADFVALCNEALA